MILFVLAFALIITICGTSAAASTQQTATTIHSSNPTLSTHTTTKVSSSKTAKKKGSSSDPIINGTVTIKEYNHIRNLANAKIIIKSNSGRTLATTSTNSNGFYSTSFYSTDQSFKVTASYIGCTNITNTVQVTLNSTDNIAYGSSNFQLTPLTAWWDGTYGYNSNIYITYYGSSFNSGQLNTKVTGNSNTYKSYCIDLYTEINPNDLLLVNGPLPGTSGDVPKNVDWGKVTYILTHYDPANNKTTSARNIEGAAIQAAIWYFTSSVYGAYPGTDTTHQGYYQFLTAPNDGKIGGTTGSTAVRNRALQIVSQAQSMSYPSTITVTPTITRIPNGGTSTITATVKDKNGNPMPGVTVNFQTSSGTLSITTGNTNANGQVSTILSKIPNSSTATVMAFVTGNYGNLLYDDQYGTRKQNLASVNLLPQTLNDISIINSDVTANIAISQNVNSPVNVGDLVTYKVTVTNQGPNTATGILITDFAPSGLNGVSIAYSSGTTYYNGVWTIPSLISGASATLTITGTATPAMAGLTTTNTVIRTAQDQYNYQPDTSTASVYTNYQNVVYVSPNGDDTTGDGSKNKPYKTIKTAITAVSPGGVIHLDIGTYNEHDLIIDKNLSILGDDAIATIIDAQQLGRIFTVNSGANVLINNLTLINGYATGNGGAINNAGTLTVTGCNLVNNHATGTGGTLYNTGNAVLQFNRIDSSTGNIIASPSGSVNAKLNWWESNDSPKGFVSGNVDVSTWLVLSVNASPKSIKKGKTSTVTADLTHDNTGANHDPASGHVPDGITLYFNCTLGNLSPKSGGTINGKVTTTFTATSNSGEATITVYGSPAVSTNIDITAQDIYVSPNGDDKNGDGTASNPYATIEKGIRMTATGGTLHVASGTYQESYISIDNDIKIIGDGADSTIIDAQGLGRIFTITEDANVEISGFSFINGNTEYNGGAINNAGTLKVTECNFVNNIAQGSGNVIYNTGTATFNFNRILGDGILISSPSGSVNALVNWWGSNDDPSGKVSDNVNVNTWLILTITASSNNISTGENSYIYAEITHDQNGVYYDPSSGHVPDGLDIRFISNLGTLNPIDNILNGGSADSNFKSSQTGTANINAIVDGYTVSTKIYIGSVDLYVTQYPWYYDTKLGYVKTYSYNTYPIFVLDVENWGADDATGVVVTYKIGTGLQYVTSNTQGVGTASYDPTTRTITWTIGDMPTGGMAWMLIVTKAIQTGDKTQQLTNTASLEHVDQYDEPNNYKTSNYSITVPPNADIQVKQTQTTTTENGVNYVNYTITVTNNGPGTATGVQITDLLPNGLTWYSDNSNNAYNPTTGIWNIGTLNNAETTTITIKAIILGSGTIKNTAALTAENEEDWNYNNNAETINLIISGKYDPKVDLYVTQYPWYYDTKLGYVKTYSYNTYPIFVLDVENWGADDATGVVVTYKIGTGLQYVTSNTQGVGTASYDPTTRTITWTIGDMPTGGMAWMLIVTKAIQTGDKTQQLTNTASLEHVDQYDEPNNYKTSNYSITVPPNADIQVKQTQTTTTENGVNYVNYTITVTNNGPGTATGVQITDLLPNGLTWYSDNSNNAYNPTTGIWNIGTLNNAETTTITIKAIILGSGTIKNTAALTAENEEDWNYNNNAETTDIYGANPA
ncbi:MAG: Ig-like domain-containing protein [Methanobacterium sp. ERen5]|nr:MAG: Ig-like domain-containing protein [Methanobacterium sp. ERen5]